MVAIIERVIEANDKPRAEVMIDVQILEVSRERAKQYGLDLGSYSAALSFSPERRRPDGEGLQSQHHLAGHQHRRLLPGPAVSRGAFPRERFADQGAGQAASARAEGQKLSLNLGEDVPIPSTTFTPLAARRAPPPAR